MMKVQIIVDLTVKAMPPLTESDLLQRRRTSLQHPVICDQQSIRAITAGNDMREVVFGSLESQSGAE
jgi:hypothetical protein